MKLLNSMAPDPFFYRNMASDNPFSQIISDGNPLLFPLKKNKGMGLNRGIITVPPTSPFLAKLSCTACIRPLTSVEINEIFRPYDLIPDTLLKLKDASPGRQTLDRIQTRQPRKTCTSTTSQHPCLPDGRICPWLFSVEFVGKWRCLVF